MKQFLIGCDMVHAGAGAVQQCWLQQGVGQAAGPAVLVDSGQHARGSGAGFKYQDVVRRKADRAALEVQPHNSLLSLSGSIMWDQHATRP